MGSCRLLEIISLLLLQACTLESTTATTKPDSDVNLEIKMSTNQPAKALDTEDRNDPRSQIPIRPEQLNYLTEGVKNAVRVISGEVKLTDIEIVFGTGKDTAPKGPGAKLVRFYSKEVVGKRMGVSFTRRENNPTWFAANFSEAPNNYPKGIYKMDLPQSFFNGMVLDKAFTTKPTGPNDVTPPRNIFEFRLTQSSVPLKITFEARPDVSNIEDRYPKSFSNVEIIRADR